MNHNSLNTNKKLGSDIVLATHNLGKVEEFTSLFERLPIRLRSFSEMGVTEEPEETESTFSGNALLKARAGVRQTSYPCLADDSGLVIPDLDGMPGVLSARWAEIAGKSRDFGVACDRVYQALLAKGCQPCGTRAYFVVALALVLPDGEEVVFEESCHGSLTFPSRGGNGFGYDPIFIKDGYTQTFGEMDRKEKEALSHRTEAFEKLHSYFWI